MLLGLVSLGAYKIDSVIINLRLLKLRFSLISCKKKWGFFYIFFCLGSFEGLLFSSSSQLEACTISDSNLIKMYSS